MSRLSIMNRKSPLFFGLIINSCFPSVELLNNRFCEPFFTPHPYIHSPLLAFWNWVISFNKFFYHFLILDITEWTHFGTIRWLQSYPRSKFFISIYNTWIVSYIHFHGYAASEGLSSLGFRRHLKATCWNRWDLILQGAWLKDK